MVPRWTLIIAYFLGDMMGIIAMAICAGSTDKMEEKKKIRQRCRAGESQKG